MSFEFRRMSSVAIVATLLLAACAGSPASVAPTAIPVPVPTAAPATQLPAATELPAAA